MPCPATSEPTLAVLLYDDVMEETKDKDLGRLSMAVAEVNIYANDSELRDRAVLAHAVVMNRPNQVNNQSERVIWVT